jgi:hypothetical protein
MIAPPFAELLPSLIAAHGGTEVQREPSDAAEVPLYEHSWNHTTLQVLKTDKTITYLQTLFPAPNHLDLIAKLERMFGDEVPMHLEFVRFGGTVCAFGLQLVRYTSRSGCTRSSACTRKPARRSSTPTPTCWRRAA